MLQLPVARLRVTPDLVVREPCGDLDALVAAFLRGAGPGGLVVLGAFGSGKTTLCARFAEAPPEGSPPCTVVPLSVIGRSEHPADALFQRIGAARLAEAREGRRVLILDGLDEVPDPPGGYHALLHAIVERCGPRWMLTSRTSHVRTTLHADADQADTLAMPGVDTVVIEPIPRATVAQVFGELPGGRALLATVSGLEDLATSPLLLRIVHMALPFIEPGRPIDAWGLFDAWLRYALHTGPQHAEALAGLEDAVWTAWRRSGWSPEASSLDPAQAAALRLPAPLRRALLVTEIDGRVRFGHRSVFEYLLSCTIAPQLAANQGHGPDEISGLRITDATRAFLVGRLPRMPVRFHGDRALIPRGNFVAGGAESPDERPLRIQHLAEPFWLARVPVLGRDWAAWLAERPDPRQDAQYLAHWGPERRLPDGQADLPVWNLWPEDADAYAADHGARLPTADEWEKAVRGVDGRRWPWGDHLRAGALCTAELGLDRPLPVRALGAWGEAHLFSAVGGVFECTSSWWRERPDRGRVVMGGCFSHPVSHARPSLRLSHRLSGHLKMGLRLAWDA